MYKTYSAQDYKRLLGLPQDYKIDGMLIYGTWDHETQVKKLITTLDNLKINYKINNLPDFLIKVLEIETNNKKFWFNVAYGGALLTEFVHLACLFGSKQNILIGSCGGLSEKLNSNTVILPDLSYGDGSTSSMYQREIKNNLYPSNNELRNQLALELLNNKIKYAVGKTMTCQAMMAETMEDVIKWNKEGYIGVEMEASAVFSVSNHFGVKSSAMVILSDNLIKEETITSESYQNSKGTRLNLQNKLYEISLQQLINN